MGGVYYMYANRYTCPICRHEWTSKGKEMETENCPKCWDEPLHPNKSEEVDYEQYD